MLSYMVGGLVSNRISREELLSLVLAVVMFGSVACGSGSDSDIVVDVVAECFGGGSVQTGAPCFRDSALEHLLRDAHWKVTIRTAEGTTYTVEAPASRRPQIGQKWN